MSQDHAALVTQFQDVTGTEEERAKFYLEAANWRLEVALGSFYESDGAAEADVAMLEDDNPQSDEVIPERTGPATRSRTSRSQPIEISDSSEEDSDEEGQAFYVGGSERSGQQVLGPPRKAKDKNSEDIVKDVFRSAKEHGAVVVEPTASSSKGLKVFSGTGHRLGQTPEDTKVVPGKKPAAKPQEVILRLWKTGFTVDQGPLRDYNDQGNLQFIASIKRGEVPLELIKAARGQEVHINLEDHRHDEFLAPKTNFQAFRGAGHTLGSPAPNFVGAPSTSVSSALGAIPKAATGTVATAQNQISLDETKPTTQIQVRLTDGSRLVAKMNLSHTLAELRSFIAGARPDLTSLPYMILSSFPTKELTQDNQTLEEAGLKNATVLMRHRV